MITTITTAANEYANRPRDERFSSVESLVSSAHHERELSAERDYNLKDLRIVADDSDLKLASPKGEATFTHWAFGQFSRMLGAPAAYLRTLPPSIAAQALNHGIQATTPGTRASLLVKAPNGKPEPTVRACTSDSYARVWDSELYGAVQDMIMSRDANWTVSEATRSDRDSFVTITNKKAVLNDPSVKAIVSNPNGDPGGIMYRSLTIGNSETGARSIWIEGGLWRARCKNLMLWSFAMERSFRRRHVGARVAVDSIRELARFAQRYINQSTERDNAIIRTLIDHQVAETGDVVIDELRALGATKDQAEAAYTRCEQTEDVSPRSYWGVAQGLTRVSQDSQYQDERFQLDQLASKLLFKGARKLVAA